MFQQSVLLPKDQNTYFTEVEEDGLYVFQVSYVAIHGMNCETCMDTWCMHHTICTDPLFVCLFMHNRNQHPQIMDSNIYLVSGLLL